MVNTKKISGGINESTFERCEHDRENPYVMISREMAQDKSISPKAKGVLLYLLSLPRDWKVYHSQLQDGLGVGEDYITSAMEELIANGYADRTRERVKGIFQPYKYKIREFKKLNPNRENQPGSTGPVNPDLQKKEKESKYTKKTTTQVASATAAVSSEKEQSKEQDFIYADLKPIDIPKKDKIEISTRYDGKTVRKAIAWATSPQVKINKGLAPAIKWACVNKPEIPQPKHVEKAKVDVTPFNRSYYRELLKIANLHSIGLRESTTEYLETENAKIYYKDRSFLEQIENFLRKKGVVDERILSTIKLCQKDLVKQVC